MSEDRRDGTSPASPERGRNLDNTSPASPERGRNLDNKSPASPERGQDLDLSASAAGPDGPVDAMPAAKLPSVVPPAPAQDGEAGPARPGSSPAARRRGRVGLRIPDDEITRPQPPVVEPRAAPEPASVVVVPTRIITINPPRSAEAVVQPAVPRAAPAPAVTYESDGWDSVPVSVDEEEPTVPHLPPTPSSRPGETGEKDDDEGDDDDKPTPAVPSASLDGERRSDPGDAPEISADDLVAVAAVPPLPRLAKKSPPPPRPPLVIIPPHVGTFAPPPESVGMRRKGRLWWEDLFNDDYVRTMERITDEQIAREVDFIEDSLGVERGGAVLDLGCGTGRHAVELARRGYEAVGCDLSLSMLARAGEEAQEREAKLNFVQGDMREMAFEEQFDGVYCWNTSFGYFEEDKNAQVVDRVHRALKAGGLFLLDVVNRDFLVRQSPSLAWFEGDGCVCMDEMSVDFITSRMRVKRTMMLDDGRSREIEYSMRVYSLHELGRILHEHGFKVCEVTGRIATPGVFFGNESPRTIILSEKR
jgi:SAM-dependent methyltransferase